VRGNIPDMTRRINDPRDTIAPELIGCRDENSRSAGGCALEGGIHILDIDVDYDGGAAVGLWGPTGQCREFPVDHDHGRANPDGGMDYGAVRTGPAREFDGAERGLAEFDFSGSVATGQHWNYHGYVAGRFFGHIGFFPRCGTASVESMIQSILSISQSPSPGVTSGN